jgi:hypothetical protein
MGLGNEDWNSVLQLMLFVPNLKKKKFSLAKAIDRNMSDVYDNKHCKLCERIFATC